MRSQPKQKKQTMSKYDKRKRLQRSNPKHKKTTSAKVLLTGAMQTIVHKKAPENLSTRPHISRYLL